MTSAYRRFFLAQQELGPTAPKIAKNPHFNSGFCPLPELLKLVVPVLHTHDLYLTQRQRPASKDGLVAVVTLVCDAETGEPIAESIGEIPYIGTDPQKWTASVTYARRTGITSVMALGEADDDGNSASGNHTPVQKSVTRTAARKTPEQELAADGAAILESAKRSAQPSKEAQAVINDIIGQFKEHADTLGTTMNTADGVNIVCKNYLIPCFAVSDWESVKKLPAGTLQAGLESLKKKLKQDLERKNAK